MLALHVVDLDARQAPPSAGEVLYLLRVIGMNMHLDRRRRADDEQRFAARFQSFAQIVDGPIGVFDNEFGAKFVLADGLRRGEHLPAHRTPGKRRSPCLRLGEKAKNTLDEIDESRASGIHDAGISQRSELLRCAVERLVGRTHDPHAQTIEVALVQRDLVGSFGGHVGNRENGSLDRTQQCVPRRRDGLAHGGRHYECIDLAAVPNVVREPAEHLRDDHTRIPASAH
jgi:hypothetical protein